MRKIRIISWILIIAVAAALWYFPERKAKDDAATQVYVYAHYISDNLQKDLNKGLKKTENLNGYRISFTNDISKADIEVGYQKGDDDKYVRFAYSPFIVGYSYSGYKDLNVPEIRTTSDYNKDKYVINLKCLFTKAVEGDTKLSSIGKFEKDYRDKNFFIIYPARNSIYWQDFYNLLLVTYNNGKMPKTEAEIRSLEKEIEKFEASEYTKAIVDYREALVRNNYYNKYTFYIMPEREYIRSDTSYAYGLYPPKTVYFNYYITARTDVGKTILDSIINLDEFYSTLGEYGYRSDKVYDISYNDGDGGGNQYNVVE